MTLYDPATTNIVAIGMFTDGAEKSAFTPFEVSLNYLKAYDPAKKYKFSIICSSSKNGAEFAGAPGVLKYTPKVVQKKLFILI